MPASIYSSTGYKAPTLDELAELDNDALCALARSIAKSHKDTIEKLTPADLAQYVTAEHQYGVHLGKSKTMTITGMRERLQKPVFWRTEINKKADAAREKIGVLSGVVGHGGQKYCSDLTARMLEEREAFASMSLKRLFKANPGTASMSRADIARARSNKKYLFALALLEVAKLRKFKCFMLTFTCPASFHSGQLQNTGPEGVYAGAYKYLLMFWASLSASLRSNFTPHTDYFGLRVTETHVDGCPHYHIVFFCNPAAESVLRKKIEKLFDNDPLRPAGYFKKYSHEIIKELDQANYDERQPLRYALKLLFDDNQSAPEIQAERNEKRRRSNLAIKAARKRAVQFFGVEGLQQKIDMVKKSARDKSACKELRAIGEKLTVDRSDLKHNEKRLAALVHFIQHETPRLELTWHARQNTYGEKIRKVIGVRLRRPPKSHPIGKILKFPATNWMHTGWQSSSKPQNSQLSLTLNSNFLRVTHYTSRKKVDYLVSFIENELPVLALLSLWLSHQSRSQNNMHPRSRGPPNLNSSKALLESRDLHLSDGYLGRQGLNERVM